MKKELTPSVTTLLARSEHKTKHQETLSMIKKKQCRPTLLSLPFALLH